jgi:hypothetical protein
MIIDDPSDMDDVERWDDEFGPKAQGDDLPPRRSRGDEESDDDDIPFS